MIYPGTHARMRARARSQDALALTHGDWQPAEDDLGEASTGSTLTYADDQEVKRGAAIERRMLSLEASYLEDYGRELNRGALEAFRCFMQYSNFQMPLLGADESGTIVATWRSGQECVSVRFLNRYYVDFAVTYVAPQGLKREWGRSNLATVHSECPHLRRIANLK